MIIIYYTLSQWLTRRDCFKTMVIKIILDLEKKPQYDPGSTNSPSSFSLSSPTLPYPPVSSTSCLLLVHRSSLPHFPGMVGRTRDSGSIEPSPSTFHRLPLTFFSGQSSHFLGLSPSFFLTHSPSDRDPFSSDSLPLPRPLSLSPLLTDLLNKIGVTLFQSLFYTPTKICFNNMVRLNKF